MPKKMGKGQVKKSTPTPIEPLKTPMLVVLVSNGQTKEVMELLYRAGLRLEEASKYPYFKLTEV